MQNYSKAISNQRRIEFRKADHAGKKQLKGTHYRLLKNSEKLNDKQTNKLNELPENNANINTLYILK